MNPSPIKVSAVVMDLDDTLIHTLPYYVQVNTRVYRAIKDAGIDITHIDAVFAKIERDMVRKHLYAAHRFPRSLRMLYEEMCALQNVEVDYQLGHRIEGMGWDLYNKNHTVIDDAEHILQYLKDRDIRLICFTKGDPVVQRRKLIRSGLFGYFNNVVVTPDKDISAYRRLRDSHNLDEKTTLMVGDSIYSDINPSGAAGFQPVWVPCKHGTWQIEEVQATVEHRTINALSELKQFVT